MVVFANDGSIIAREFVQNKALNTFKVLCFDNYLQKDQPCIYVSMHEEDKNTIADFTYADVYSCDYTKGIVNRGTIPCEELTTFKGEFEPKDEFLKVLSDYLKKKINVATLLNAYVIHLHRMQEKELSHYNCIERDYLKNVIDTDGRAD